MRDPLLRKKRIRRGALELAMPEAVLEYDADGRVTGAHFAEHNLSHQIIEEFMLAANEAVAEHFTRHEVPFLRRVHPAPNEEKLEAFAQFADLLGHPIKRAQDRFELQRVLTETADKSERKRLSSLGGPAEPGSSAVYSPVQDQHYALASQHYCHFTSPIRRYPDLQVHRLLDRWIRNGSASRRHARTRTGRARRATCLEDGSRRRKSAEAWRTGEGETADVPQHAPGRTTRCGDYRRGRLRVLRSGGAVPGRRAGTHFVAGG